MGLTLGLDLGTSSAGWAIVDEKRKKIIKTGVRIFPGAADKIGSKSEQYKNVVRRESRQARRQTFRRAQRRIVLLGTLIQLDMCPLKKDEFELYSKYRKGKPREFPKGEAFTQWLRQNPYELRDRAINGSVTRCELGRIFYHIIHHRGFKTGRKTKETGALYKGTEEVIGIDETANLLDQYSTLGECLNALRTRSNGSERLRGRYTLRKWYVDEFDKIWDKQAKSLGLDRETIPVNSCRYFGPAGSSRFRRKIANLDKTGIEYTFEGDSVCRSKTIPAKEYLGDPDTGILFYQKPLKTQRHLLSNCRYERDKKVCKISHPEFEYYRVLQFVNSIEYGSGEKLCPDQRSRAISTMLKKATKVTVKDIKQALNLPRETFNYPDDHKEPGCPAISLIRKIAKVEPEPHWSLYHEIWNDLIFYDDADMLHKKLEKKLGVDVNRRLLEESGLSEDQASLSLKAIRNIIPFFEQGMVYSDAVIFAGIRRVLGSAIYDKNQGHIKETISTLKDRPHSNGHKNFSATLVAYLKEEFQVSDKQCEKLYHHSQSVIKRERQHILPPLPNLRNPIVQQALQEVRTIVNHLIKTCLPSGDQFEKIKVELARELKLPRDVRRRMQWANKERENINNAAKETVQQFGLRPGRENIQKYLLFKEMQKNAKGLSVQCPYTGTSLSLTDVLGKNNRVHVEHIIPYSISLDDSLANKTLCMAEENGRKGERTPCQFYQSNQEKWETIKQRAFDLLPYEKAKRFVNTQEYEADSFLQRQLNDTRYISKAARTYLENVCDHVYVFPGSLTAKIRRMWGLNAILAPPVKTPFQGNSGEYWGVFNQDGTVIELHQKELPAPALTSEDICVSGKARGGHFLVDKHFTGNSPEQSFKINPDQYDSVGWMVFSISSVLSLSPYYSRLPDIPGDFFWLRGKMSVAGENASLSFNSIDAQLTIDPQLPRPGGDYLNGADYRVAVPLKSPPRKAEKTEKLGKADLLLKNLRPKNKTADIWIEKRKYSIPIQDTSDKLNLVLSFDLTGYQHCVPMLSPKPEIGEQQLLIAGKIDSAGNFHTHVNERLKVILPETDLDGIVHAVVAGKPRDGRFHPKQNLEPKKTRGKNILAGSVFHEDDQKADQKNNQKNAQKANQKDDQKNDGVVFMPSKSRMDHRHHAVDALAISLLNMKQLKDLSTYNARWKQRLRQDSPRPHFKLPWGNFRQDALRSINKILVVHRQNKDVVKTVVKNSCVHGRWFTTKSLGVRGQIHKDTVYGKRQRNHDAEPGYHVRKRIQDITSLDKIADPGIANIIINYLETQGYSIGAKGKIDPRWLYDENNSRLTMPNKKSENGRGNPIKKVRMRENLSNARQWHRKYVDPESAHKEGYVDPQNNYCVVLYRTPDGKLREHILSLWDAVQAKLNNRTIYEIPEPGKIVTTLHKDDLFVIRLQGGFKKIRKLSPKYISRHLYRVQKLSPGDYSFRLHTESTLDREFEPYYYRITSFKKWEELSPFKIRLTPDGDVLQE